MEGGCPKLLMHGGYHALLQGSNKGGDKRVGREMIKEVVGREMIKEVVGVVRGEGGGEGGGGKRGEGGGRGGRKGGEGGGGKGGKGGEGGWGSTRGVTSCRRKMAGGEG